MLPTILRCCIHKLLKEYAASRKQKASYEVIGAVHVCICIVNSFIIILLVCFRFIHLKKATSYVAEIESGLVEGELFFCSPWETELHLSSKLTDLLKYCFVFLNNILTIFLIVKYFVVNRWEFEESEEDPVTSIPYQLQRLFVLLQTSKKRAIETTDVTRSFGWDSSEGNCSY